MDPDLNPRQARIWNYLNSQDVFYAIRRWPTWVAALAMAEHRDNRDRFSLYHWLAANGAPSWFAQRVVLLYDVRKGQFLFGGYDAAAHRQVQQMQRQQQSGSLFDTNKTFFDMHCGSVHRVKSPCPPDKLK